LLSSPPAPCLAILSLSSSSSRRFSFLLSHSVPLLPSLQLPPLVTNNPHATSFSLSPLTTRSYSNAPAFPRRPTMAGLLRRRSTTGHYGPEGFTRPFGLSEIGQTPSTAPDREAVADKETEFVGCVFLSLFCPFWRRRRGGRTSRGGPGEERTAGRPLSLHFPEEGTKQACKEREKRRLTPFLFLCTAPSTSARPLADSTSSTSGRT
jgi:hypothetical protein